MVNSTATAKPIGISLLRPSARLDPPTATTKRISSVAYAVDEIASDEKTASAIVFGIRWCSISVVASGRPTRTRLTNATWAVPLLTPRPELSGTQHAIRHACVHAIHFVPDAFRSDARVQIA